MNNVDRMENNLTSVILDTVIVTDCFNQNSFV